MKFEFVSEKFIEQKVLTIWNFAKTPSAQNSSSMRRLKAIGHRENRWMQDVNHCVSKALVESSPKHAPFVLRWRIGAMNLYRMGKNYLSDNEVPNTVAAE